MNRLTTRQWDMRETFFFWLAGLGGGGKLLLSCVSMPGIGSVGVIW